MTSTQALVIKLTEGEKEILDEAFEVIIDIVGHLELNRDLGLDTSRYGLEIDSDSFWKILDYCVAINVDEKELKSRVGQYGERRN